ncbi:hypothetical protein [Plantactinospora endophytica]|uniref:hypothetical protein n=1 Tax=Plantactinospora endophytica TaxID=673535 RepID=UPI001941AC97|nr:hypothetical protein [Plantactinospora endophytica]
MPGPAAAGPPPTDDRASSPAPPADPTTVSPADRDQVIGAGWRTSQDLLWTTVGDSRGFHLLVAEASTGFTWRTAATLVEPSISSDQWVGNVCLTGSGDRAVVAYQPRHFTNREHLFNRGAFAAIVDLGTGQVTKLDTNVSIAYHNPGCGADERAALVTGGATDLGMTRVQVVDTVTRSITMERQLSGQVTSAVPFGKGFAAIRASDILAVSGTDPEQVVASTRGLSAHLRPVGANGMAFLERVDDHTALVRHVTDGVVRDIARGPATDLGLAPGLGGQVFVTGSPTPVAAMPAGMRAIKVPATSTLSTTGAAAVLRTDRSGTASGAEPAAVSIVATTPTTGKATTFQVTPGLRPANELGSGRRPAPQLSASAVGIASATSPFEEDRYCSVPRNTLDNQVEQPHWKQVEWAANMAVQDALTFTRPAGWRGSGLPAWTPRSVAPPKALAGGGTVPAQIMLAILAQESNLWQASWHALEGVVGNPLVGAYYGTREGWFIDWAEADCGYGVAQVTDGMRLAGRGKPGEVIRPYTQQRQIALDYATNIQAGLQILQDKWNQTYNAGIRIHNADPSRIENWFAAVWAYNSGLNPQASTGNTSGCTPGPSCTDHRGAWGLGWGNNPANPDYRFDRNPFLNGENGEGSPSDAARPQDWPYPEKIMGWAAYPIVKTDFRLDGFYEPAYRQAWWLNEINRSQGIKPWLDTFCGTLNNCSLDRNTGEGSCGYADYHCWWHWPASWQTACEQSCGYRADLIPVGTAEPARGTHYPPQCRIETMPADAYIIDDQPASSPVVRSDLCPTKTRNDGTFTLQFSGAANGTFPAKRDFHQIGSGLNGHYWFGHEYSPETEAASRVKVTGTWQLGRSLNQWAKVYVHMPNRGGRTQQAHYKIDRGAGATGGPRYKWRVLGQKYEPYNRWVSLGTFQFNGTPRIELSNITRTAIDRSGVDSVMWDAVAIVPLSAKPRNFVVGLGDSYSSGEGVIDNAARDYSPESNHDGDGVTAYRNGCHRSRYSWLHQASLADDQRSIGTRSDQLDPQMDLQFPACSGAQAEHMFPSGHSPITNLTVNDPATGQPFKTEWGEPATGTMREVTQMDRGFLDENTTLVTLTVGGNDIGWHGALKECLANVLMDCMNAEVDDERIADFIPINITRYLPNTVTAVLRAIKLLAPNAKVVLLGYPELISNQADCLRIPGIPFQISTAEDEWIRQMVHLLDSTLNDIVTNARSSLGLNVRYGSSIGEFLGSGICGASPGIHSVLLGNTDGEKPNLFSSHSFHPNMRGGQLYRNVLNRELRALGI